MTEVSVMSEAEQLRAEGLELNAKDHAREFMAYLVSRVNQTVVNMSTGDQYGALKFKTLDEKNLWVATMKMALANEFKKQVSEVES